MKEFECWKESVIQAISSKGISVPDANSLSAYWNSDYSVEQVLMVREAECLSSQPKVEFDAANRCGCFHCVRFFKPEDIKWESGQAECPYCGIDSVLPETKDYIVSPDLLEKLKLMQFTSNVHIW